MLTINRQYINTNEGINLRRILVYTLFITISYCMYIYICKDSFSLISLFIFLAYSILIYGAFNINDYLNPFVLLLIDESFHLMNFVDVNINKESLRYSSILGTLDNDQGIFLLKAILIVVLWYSGILISFKIFRSLKSNIDKFKLSMYKIRHLNLIGNVFFIISIISFLIIYRHVGGINNILDGMGSRSETYSGLGYFMKGVRLGLISAMLYLADGRKFKSIIVLILTTVAYILFGGRNNAFFGILFVYVIFYHYYYKKITIKHLTILAIIGVIISNFVLVMRFKDTSRDVKTDNIQDIVLELSHSSQRADILASVIQRISTGEIEYQYGKTLVNIFYAPIPRSIYKAKPIIDDAGYVGHLVMGDDYWGLPMGSYGLAYLNFGITGVITGSILVGYIIRLLYNTLSKINKDSNCLYFIMYSMIIMKCLNLLSTKSQIDMIMDVVIVLSIIILDKFICKIGYGR